MELPNHARRCKMMVESGRYGGGREIELARWRENFIQGERGEEVRAYVNRGVLL